MAATAVGRVEIVVERGAHVVEGAVAVAGGQPAFEANVGVGHQWRRPTPMDRGSGATMHAEADGPGVVLLAAGR